MSAYPIWPPAPVTATLRGFFMGLGSESKSVRLILGGEPRQSRESLLRFPLLELALLQFLLRLVAGNVGLPLIPAGIPVRKPSEKDLEGLAALLLRHERSIHSRDREQISRLLEVGVELRRRVSSILARYDQRCRAKLVRNFERRGRRQEHDRGKFGAVRPGREGRRRARTVPR